MVPLCHKANLGAHFESNFTWQSRTAARFSLPDFFTAGKFTEVPRNEFPFLSSRGAVSRAQAADPFELDTAAGVAGARPAAADADSQQFLRRLLPSVFCRPLCAALVQSVERKMVYGLLADHVSAAGA